MVQSPLKRDGRSFYFKKWSRKFLSEFSGSFFDLFCIFCTFYGFPRLSEPFYAFYGFFGKFTQFTWFTPFTPFTDFTHFLRNLRFLRIFLRKSVNYFYGFTAFTACRKVYAIFRGQDLSRKTVKVRCLLHVHCQTLSAVILTIDILRKGIGKLIFFLVSRLRL